MRYGLYLHIPFCQHRCSYCDFNTYAGLGDLIPSYVQALGAEIRGVGRLAQIGARSAAVGSVYFGGGTPSLIPADDVGWLLDNIRASFELAADAEITLEANPGTVDASKFEGLRRVGVNRISLGMQSSHSHELQLLERQHGMQEVRQAVGWARQAGFSRLNLDLIYALPGQSMSAWQSTLQATLELSPDHISLYALSLEFGTPIRKWVEDGRIPEPEADLAADMYEWASETLAREDYGQYELSNWARAGRNGQSKACRHNLHVWRFGEYLGLGAGAHGFTQGWRLSATRSPRAYIERLADPHWLTSFPFTPATAWSERQDLDRMKGDWMMLGLRLTEEGVSEQAYERAFAAAMGHDFGATLDGLVRDGLVERTSGGVRLTARGRLLGNRVFESVLLPQPARRG